MMGTDPDPQTLFDLRNRVAIVTGASSGLGARFALVLAAGGATVIATGRRRERLEALAADTELVVPFQCDVTDHADLERLVDFTRQRYGEPNILVNNAGIKSPGDVTDETPDTFRRISETNVDAVYALSRLVAPHMRDAGGGAIVNISSIFGLVAAWPGGQAAYAASKGAIVQLTRELGTRWASDGVRVNAIAPGFFASEMNDGLFADEQWTRWMRRNSPVGRIGRPHELDGVLLLLTSGAGTYLTGQTIAVDGGWTAR